MFCLKSPSLLYAGGRFALEEQIAKAAFVWKFCYRNKASSASVPFRSSSLLFPGISTYLNDLIQLCMILLLLQRAPRRRRSGSGSSLGVGSQIHAGPRALRHLVSRVAGGSFGRVGGRWVAGGGCASGRCSYVLVHLLYVFEERGFPFFGGLHKKARSMEGMAVCVYTSECVTARRLSVSSFWIYGGLL